MPHFRIQIDGKNFLIDLDGKVAKYGFITFRFVEAEDAAAAEMKAVESVRGDPELQAMVLNETTDPPVMDVIEIAEFAEPPEPVETQPGRIWYEMNPRRWWQFWRR